MAKGDKRQENKKKRKKAPGTKGNDKRDLVVLAWPSMCGLLQQVSAIGEVRHGTEVQGLATPPFLQWTLTATYDANSSISGTLEGDFADETLQVVPFVDSVSVPAT